MAAGLVGRVGAGQDPSTSEELGKAPALRVRVFGSINAGKAPLWVVDGMP